LSCYTFGGSFRDSEDVRLGRRIAGLCRQPYEVVEVGREFVEQFPRYAERSVYLTEGGVDVYRASDLYLSEKARQIAPVKVVGTYGSEIVRHAVMFKPMVPQADLFQPALLPLIEEARRTYARVRQEHPVTFAAFRQSPWYHHGILALEQSQLTVRSPFLDGDFLRTVYREPKRDDPEDDVRLRLIADGDPALARIRSDRGVGGGGNRIATAISRSVLEFTFKAEYAYDYGMPQWLARIDGLLSPLHLERLFLGRHKLLHFRVWYRDALADYVRQVLLDPKTLARSYLKPRMLESIVNAHTRGERNYTTAIHKLLTMELLHRLFVD
jgi:asparagine synthase (glutamine-hydrolysing)